jgi:hypothetical protein
MILSPVGYVDVPDRLGVAFDSKIDIKHCSSENNMIGDVIGDEPSCKISEQVLDDTNNDNSGDVEIDGVTVQLKDPNGTIIMPTMTDCNGNFTLNASPGMSTIFKQTPPGFVNVGSSTISGNTSSGNALNIFSLTSTPTVLQEV